MYEEVCSVCLKNKAQYKCPACGCMTCSVKCVKEHKKRDKCNGQKPTLDYLSVNQMNEFTLIKDCELLDKATRASINASEKIPPKVQLKKYQKRFISACKDRGITFHYMPLESTRSHNNRTKLEKNGDSIHWTINWRFFSCNKEMIFETYTHYIDENIPLFEILKAVIDTAQNTSISTKNPLDVSLLLVAEGFPSSTRFSVDTQQPLSYNLAMKTIIEFPIIDVVDLASTPEWNIVEPFASIPQEFTEEPVQEANSKEDLLPNYEDIKKALKMDIIQTIEKETQNIEDNK